MFAFVVPDQIATSSNLVILCVLSVFAVGLGAAAEVGSDGCMT